MFIKKLDLLSPPITLYYKGDNQHPTIISAILSIIAYTGVFGFGIYYGLKFINKDNPSSYFFNRYVEDAGTYPVNASSMFHFLQTLNTETNQPKPTDFDAFRIIGLEDTPDVYTRDNNLSKYDHWLYGPCNNQSDTEGISYLIDFKYYEQSACIRKFYDKKKRNYYEPDNTNFRWPLVSKGASNPSRTFYGVIMEKCRNDEVRILSGASACKSDNEIEGIIRSSMISFNIIDNYADVLNYKKPFTKYLYSIQSGLFPGSICENHLNFNPVIMTTHNGIFMDNIVEEPSYLFSQNEKATVVDEVQDEFGQLIMTVDEEGNTVPKKTGMVIMFYFWMQNRMQYYERNYQRLQDVLGDIGGLGNIIFILAEMLNYMVCHYVILIDTEDLLISLEEKQNNKKKLSKLPTIYKRYDKARYNFPPKRKYSTTQIDIYDNINNPQISSNCQRLVNNGIDVWKKNSVNDNEKNQKEIFNIDDKDKKVYFRKKQKKKIGYSGKLVQYYNRRNKIDNNLIIETYINTNDILSKEKNNNHKSDSMKNKESNKKNGFTWFKYIWYILHCGKNNPKISYFYDFRKKLISEENIIRNYFDINKLLKIIKVNDQKSKDFSNDL